MEYSIFDDKIVYTAVFLRTESSIWIYLIALMYSEPNLPD